MPLDNVMGGAEELFEHEDALGMMAQCPVPIVGDDGFGFVEPVVELDVVLDGAAPFADGRKGVVMRMVPSALPHHVSV